MIRLLQWVWHHWAIPLACGLLLAAGYAAKQCLELRPAQAYEDKGVHTFTAAARVLQAFLQNGGPAIPG